MGLFRLLGLLWSFLEGTSLLLLEEPELSLNDAIVRQIPLMLQRIQRDSKRRRQVLISTHSEALLSNPGNRRPGSSGTRGDNGGLAGARDNQGGNGRIESRVVGRRCSATKDTPRARGTTGSVVTRHIAVATEDEVSEAVAMRTHCGMAVFLRG